MRIEFFQDVLDEDDVIDKAGDKTILYVSPERSWIVTRDTMEEEAFRTAVTYTDNDKPSLFYSTSVKGISCRSVAL